MSFDRPIMNAAELVKHMSLMGGEPEPEPEPAFKVALQTPNFPPGGDGAYKAIPVQWRVGELVYRKHGDPTDRGWIVAIHSHPGNNTYTVRWIDGSQPTDHHGFELEDAG